MKKLFLYAKIALVIAGVGFFAVCLSWLGEVFHAARWLPWYKSLGAAVLLIVVAGMAFLWLHSVGKEREESRRRIAMEVSFERGSEIDKYARARGLTQADIADFVERAATRAAFEANKKDRE